MFSSNLVLRSVVGFGELDLRGVSTDTLCTARFGGVVEEIEKLSILNQKKPLSP